MQFENYAREVVAVARQNVNSSFLAIESFAVTISSDASSSNMTWPFVTVPNFAAKAARLAKQTNGYLVGTAPIVQESQRKEWDDFSLKQMPTMYQDAIEYQGLNTTGEELVNASWKDIWYYNQTFPQANPAPETHAGPWLVLWNLYPQGFFAPPETNLNILFGPLISNAFYTTAVTPQPPKDFENMRPM